MTGLYSQYVYDAELLLKDAGLTASSTDYEILDIGNGLVDGNLIIDVTAIEAATGDEVYTVSLEGSNTADMSAGSVALVRKVLGNSVAPMDEDLTATGRYVVPFRNEEHGTTYRYVRLSINVAGTVATGINLRAFLAMR